MPAEEKITEGGRAERGQKLTRSRASAKAAGSSFERLIADWLRDHVSEFIDRRVKTGALDKGDISNVRLPSGERVVLELKNTTRATLAGWVQEAQQEAVNDGAALGIVVHKRHGKGKAEDQYVTMTMRELAVILNAQKA